jgi:hypothetical protein
VVSSSNGLLVMGFSLLDEYQMDNFLFMLQITIKMCKELIFVQQLTVAKKRY